MKKFWIVLGCVMLPVMAHAAQYTYFLKVQASSMRIYAKPSFGAKVMRVAKKDQLLEVAGRQKGWMKVKVPISQTGFVFGWVAESKTNYKVYRKTMKAQSTPPPARMSPSPQPQNTQKQAEKPQKQAKTTQNRSKTAQNHALLSPDGVGYRLLGGVAYSIKDYFSENGLGKLQTRIGIGVDKILNEKLWVSVPISYSTGQDFSTIGGGVDVYVSPLSFSKAIVYGKLGIGYEYLYSDNNSFHGANVLGGIGADYLINDTIAIGLEPISLIGMVYRSEDTVPFNVRGQFLLTVRAKW